LEDIALFCKSILPFIISISFLKSIRNTDR
jgi:hypothetical protein